MSHKEDTVFYYNGEEKTYTIEILGTPPTHFYDINLEERLGKYAQESKTTYYDGSMDEVRISKIARSEDWFLTQYNNQNDVLNFLTIGPEETKQKSYVNNLIIDFLENHPIIYRLLKLFFME